MRALVAAAALFLAAPGAAQAAEPSIVARDLPLAAHRTLAASAAPLAFDLVGLHWQGPGRVAFRTRTLAGRWSAWRPAAPEAEDGPDRRARERSRRGWRVGNPYWTGASDAIEYRTRGTVRRLRAYFVRSLAVAVPPRTLAVAASPPVIRRPAWRASERIRRKLPDYARTLRVALVHHTAGSNRYSAAQSAAIVRAIQLYHVRGNGWDDIGYNFLVDKYGQVFEGRFGGITRNVIGAHAQGFNAGSVGVALIGNYDGTGITPAARASLAALLAWRLDLAHIDPLTASSFISNGNPRYPRGIPVFLGAISGHRDTGFTACPGDVLYRQLPAVTRAVSATGLPKLYQPAVRGRLGSGVRFTARLSHPLPWTVTVRDRLGRVVATGSGARATVDWTWDASGARGGAYTYVIAAPGVRSASGRLGREARPLPLLSRARAEPPLITPNGDGIDDSTTISFVLGRAATVTATLVDERGQTLATLFSEPRPAGPHSFVFSAEAVPDGAYTIVLRAVAGRAAATANVTIVVTRAFVRFAVGLRRL